MTAVTDDVNGAAAAAAAAKEFVLADHPDGADRRRTANSLCYYLSHY